MGAREDGSGWMKAAFWLGLLAVASLVTTFTDHSYVGGPIGAVVFGAAAARCWYLGG